MDIKELTERYQDRFDAHYLQDDNGTGRKGRKLVGGFSIDEDFNLYFTPLFHGKACGKSHKIDSIGQLVEIIREQFERREVKMKG